jgi:hypothetical protein
MHVSMHACMEFMQTASPLQVETGICMYLCMHVCMYSSYELIQTESPSQDTHTNVYRCMYVSYVNMLTM